MTIQIYPDSRYPTSIVHFPPAKDYKITEDTPLFIWIPGNPGLLEYYTKMLRSLHDKYPTWEILGVSHAGMSNGNQIKNVLSTKVYTLDEQVSHKVEVINNFSSPKRNIIIMGHSVGAYMAQRVIMDSNLIGNVIKLGLVTPTVVDIHRSVKGIKMTRAFNLFRELPIFLGLLSTLAFSKLFPAIFTRWLLTIIMGCKNNDNHAADASTVFLTNGSFVKQCLGLASHEMKHIRDDWNFQKRLIDYCNKENVSTWFLFSSTDHWVSDDTRNELINFYRTNCKSDILDVSVSNIIPHSFVINFSDFTVNSYF
ncbi:hypothetical protein TBLA_0C04450 [Henningerozyma blattae CBS 6284]|uniref:Lipid droplet-associated hydrolase n=1 Tax=Henningerozyma blattae (strain ATCC 34711 / CBS 6284 / DSM 70876 / NBRC 10599 / NRRL Y-10934 / UCD 77-7) TaxID=1071380 RepID=I2H1J0_HENB6|nr:hypothetical protein TBLA_0C04450 [Tetrapisispora blattae CBS 6284]CCH60242.1 hypothetical protein TBLA_0C04450 [Tetrapisispora blattae CBS 6284]